MIYRKIWEQSFGPIPKDEQGRSYEIHHIDSDKNNNNISNLMCISIDEHYKIHLDQGDYFSARLIASRMNLSDNELLKILNEMEEILIHNHRNFIKLKIPSFVNLLGYKQNKKII